MNEEKFTIMDMNELSTNVLEKKKKVRVVARIIIVLIPLLVFIIIIFMYKSANSKNDDLKEKLTEKTNEFRELEIKVANLETENEILFSDKKALEEKLDNITDEKYRISSDIRYLETKLASRFLLITYEKSKDDLMVLRFTNVTGTTRDIYVNWKDSELGESQVYKELADYIAECEQDEMLIIAFIYDNSKIHNKEYKILNRTIEVIKKENDNILYLEHDTFSKD